MNNLTIFDEITSFSFDPNIEHRFRTKSGIVWGHNKDTSIRPLLYISKPKNISEEDFNTLLLSLDIQFRKETNEL